MISMRLKKTQPILFLTCFLLSCQKKSGDHSKNPVLNDGKPDVCIKDDESLDSGCLKESTEIVLDIPPIPSLCGPDEAKQIYFCPDSIIGFVRNWGFKYNLTVLRKHYEYAKSQQVDDSPRSYVITRLVRINSSVDASANLTFSYNKSWSTLDLGLPASFIALFIDQYGKTVLTDGTKSMDSKEFVCASEKDCNDLIAYSKKLQNKEESGICGARLDFKFQESASLPLILTSLAFFPCSE